MYKSNICTIRIVFFVFHKAAKIIYSKITWEKVHLSSHFYILHHTYRLCWPHSFDHWNWLPSFIYIIIHFPFCYSFPYLQLFLYSLFFFILSFDLPFFYLWPFSSSLYLSFFLSFFSLSQVISRLLNSH